MCHAPCCCCCCAALPDFAGPAMLLLSTHPLCLAMTQLHPYNPTASAWQVPAHQHTWHKGCSTVACAAVLLPCCREHLLAGAHLSGPKHWVALGHSCQAPWHDSTKASGACSKLCMKQAAGSSWHTDWGGKQKAVAQHVKLLPGLQTPAQGVSLNTQQVPI